MPNTITDITYGIPVEVWPRDYSKVEALLMFWRKINSRKGHDGRWPCVLHTFRGRFPPVTR